MKPTLEEYIIGVGHSSVIEEYNKFIKGINRIDSIMNTKYFVINTNNIFFIKTVSFEPLNADRFRFHHRVTSIKCETAAICNKGFKTLDINVEIIENGYPITEEQYNKNVEDCRKIYIDRLAQFIKNSNNLSLPVERTAMKFHIKGLELNIHNEYIVRGVFEGNRNEVKIPITDLIL